jgi:U4/U6 small nuclear ribonucleoprotein PRP31
VPIDCERSSLSEDKGHPYGYDEVSDLIIVSQMPTQKSYMLFRCILAARVDSFRDSPDGSIGQQYFDEIQKKLEKFNEPPPAKKEKALPVPTEGRKKRRGGARFRKQKELFAMTEIRRQANRVKFGEEAQTEYMGADFGMLGQGSGGTAGSKLRVAISEQAPKLSKKRKKELEKESGFKTSGFKTARYGGTATAVSGFTSSFAITETQGLDLGNPEAKLAAQERVREANNQYFSELSGFIKVKKEDPNQNT